jgi:hypothetical protein
MNQPKQQTAAERLEEAIKKGHTLSYEDAIEVLERHRRGYIYYGQKNTFIAKDALAIDLAIVSLTVHRGT